MEHTATLLKKKWFFAGQTTFRCAVFTRVVAFHTVVFFAVKFIRALIYALILILRTSHFNISFLINFNLVE